MARPGSVDLGPLSRYSYWGYIGIMEKKMETTIWGLGFSITQSGDLGDIGLRVYGSGCRI